MLDSEFKSSHLSNTSPSNSLIHCTVSISSFIRRCYCADITQLATILPDSAVTAHGEYVSSVRRDSERIPSHILEDRFPASLLLVDAPLVDGASGSARNDLGIVEVPPQTNDYSGVT